MKFKTRKVFILKHVPNEDAGTILDFLKKEKIEFETVALYDGAILPSSLEWVRAVVVMGGPMNVYEETRHPFLKIENTFIQAVVKNRIPYLGICLGAQLLAKALGAKVYKAKAPEVGWFDVELEKTKAAGAENIFSGLHQSTLRVLQWHEDTFDLPQGARLLARGQTVSHQAYGGDGLFFGLQFHVEVNRPMIEDWFKKREDLSAILTEFDSYSHELSKLTEKIYRDFFKIYI